MEYSRKAGPSRIPLPNDLASDNVRSKKLRPRRLLSILHHDDEEGVHGVRASSEILEASLEDCAEVDQAYTGLYKPSEATLEGRGPLGNYISGSSECECQGADSRSQSEEPVEQRRGRDQPVAATDPPLETASDPWTTSGIPERRLPRFVGNAAGDPSTSKAPDPRDVQQHTQLAGIQTQRRKSFSLPTESSEQNLEIQLQSQASRPLSAQTGRQDPGQASLLTEQQPADSSRRPARKRRSDEESQKTPVTVRSSKRRIRQLGDKENAILRSSSGLPVGDDQEYSLQGQREGHIGAVRSRQIDEGGAAAPEVLRSVEHNRQRVQQHLPLPDEIDSGDSVGSGKAILSHERQGWSGLSDRSLDVLEQCAASDQRNVGLNAGDVTRLEPTSGAVANGKSEENSLLHDLHAISQEFSGKGLWECNEPSVRPVDLKTASYTAVASPTAPPADDWRRFGHPCQHAAEPATSLTPPSAAMVTPNSWVYRVPVNNGTQSPQYLQYINEQTMQAAHEHMQLPPVLDNAEVQKGAVVTPEGAALQMLGRPCGEQEPTSLPQPEMELYNPSTQATGQDADEATCLVGKQRANDTEVVSAGVVPRKGGQASTSLECTASESIMGEPASDVALSLTQACHIEHAREDALSAAARNAIAADSSGRDGSWQVCTSSGHARLEQANERLLEGLDDFDFADLDLTPATQSETGTSPQRASDWSTTKRDPQRTRSGKGRTDSFDDLAEDHGFWDEVFDGEMLPHAMAIEEATEWQDSETLSDIEAAASAASELPPMPCCPPPGVHLGFSTAANKRLVQPSEAAVARVMKRLGQPAGSEEAPEKDIERMGAALNTRRAAQSVSSPAMRAFQSYAATCEGQDRRDEYQSEEDQKCSQLAPAASPTMPTIVSFRRANGLPLELSASALDSAKRRMALWEAQHRQEKDRSPDLSASMEHEQMLTNSSLVRSVLTPREARSACVVPAIEPSLTKGPVSPSAQGLVEIARNTPGQHYPAKGDIGLSKGPELDAASIDPLYDFLPPTPSETAESHLQEHSQLVTPAKPAVKRLTGSLATAGKEISTPDRPVLTRLEGRSSRISLGMTPRANLTPKTAGRSTFKTPFKTGTAGARPFIMSSSGSPLAVTAQIRAHPQESRRSPKRLVGGALDANQSEPSVFQLGAIVPRLSLKQCRMRPYATKPLLAEEVPHEIMTIINEPRKSFCWVFDSPTGEERGVKAAFEELKKAGAMRVDLAWVRNHWIMILWKLAHYTRCKPQEAALWWCFEQVMRQLKYRYEREVNLAQRSAIKRIQERDSPASLPMILRVFGHHKVNAEDVDSLGAMSKVKDRTCGDYDYELELTDGWYRIRARMDPTLSRAFKRGKIAQGMKLAIQGARLDSSSMDGNDVLAASGISHLVLSGNGTSPAPWDSRMGFQKHAFSASLRSLTADGGLIPSMEVTITRLFPIAFVESNGSSTHQMGSARGAAEEADAQRAWETLRDDSRSRLEGKIAQNLKQITEIQDLLTPSMGYGSGSAHLDRQEDCEAERDSNLTSEYEDEADDTLENLLSSDTPSSTLASRLRSIPRTAHRHFLCHLSYLASTRSERMQSDARAQMEQELNKMCPLRRVRSFRVCRFVDAREGDRKKACKRTVQLTVWDLGDTDQDTLEEGATYKVTNLVPTQRSSWRSCKVEADAFLATRRDSTWKRLT